MTAIHSNPFRDEQAPHCKCECDCSISENSSHHVRYFNGEVQYAVTDVQSAALGSPWGHTRYYSNRLKIHGDLADADKYQGNGWLVDEWPHLADDEGVMYAVLRHDEIVAFDIVSDPPNDPTYTPRNGSQYTLTHSAPYFVLIDNEGNIYRFNDGSETPEGMFYSHTSPGGVVTQVLNYSDPDEQITLVERTIDGTTPLYERFVYRYDQNSKRLTSVLLRRKTGSGAWDTDHNVLEAVYTYGPSQ